jgi:Mor family transcriptional regulator
MKVNIKERRIINMSNERNAGRKRTLTPLEEVEIYQAYKGGEGILSLVLRFRVSESTIHRTLKRIENKISCKVN